MQAHTTEHVLTITPDTYFTQMRVSLCSAEIHIIFNCCFIYGEYSSQENHSVAV